MTFVSFTLNGRRQEVPEGTTILDAARAAGLFIPTFCSDERLEPFASCFICVVEIAGRGTLAPACSTVVQEGMDVLSESERVLAARRFCLELLLSDHVGDCRGPCTMACPAEVDIPGFLAALAGGDNTAAVEIIRRTMPFPGVLGRVCTRPCERNCRRSKVEAPVAICQLHRFAADAAPDAPLPVCAPASGRRVAVVGAGPAGLSAAWYLQLLGHDCTIFDEHEQAGGMLRYGIPAYRLPPQVMVHEAAQVERLGAHFRFGVRVGRDIAFEDLQHDYDAVFFGLGAQRAKPLKIAGEELDGVRAGVDFLKTVARGEKVAVGSRVLVVGGGNTAVDAARVARRLGASSVTLLYRRSRREMPAWEEEVRAAEDEGVTLAELEAPLRLERNEDGSMEVTCIAMRLSEPDASGRSRPEPMPGSEHIRKADLVVTALGQEVEPEGLDGMLQRGLLLADPHTGQTVREGVFAGGDCVSDARLAVEAVAAGRRVAYAMDRWLRSGRAEDDASHGYDHQMDDETASAATAGIAQQGRAVMPEIPLQKRCGGFTEVETGFSPKSAQEEAARCLKCACSAASDCRLREYAALFGARQERFSGAHRSYEHDASHAEVVHDRHKCIQCGLCVRLAERAGTPVLGFAGRGFNARVMPALERPLADVAAGADLELLAAACPVGALVSVTKNDFEPAT
ncbi:MAG: FAD-dependent oxidoreductase [Deltaproteobacteria bacterium]|nr:FAD-dependent oxidoreductase [Deltaproteobacteria bacterium]